MKILYIITGLGLGGAETITVSLAERIQAIGHPVGIISLAGEQEIPVGEYIPVWNLRMEKSPKGLLAALWKAKKIVDDFRPDVVHGHMFHAVLFSRIMKVISTEHNKVISTEHTNTLGRQLRMLAYRLTDFLSDKNTNVSQEATDYFIQEKAFSRRKSLAVYNGIDTSRFKQNGNGWKIRNQYGIAPDDFVFVNVARLMPAKDQRNLLKAFASLDLQDKRLLLVGKGELETDLRQYAKELGLEQSVVFCGAQRNVEDYCNAADCFVLSSAWEGFGLVLAEAMACQLPVVSTDCGGTAEVVQDSRFLVPPCDSSALAEKMREIAMMSRQERIELGQLNRSKAKRFDIGHIVDTWLELYIELGGERGSRLVSLQDFRQFFE